MEKIILIGNPVAGKGASKKIERAMDIIKSRGFDVQLMLTEKRSDAEAFAEQICSKFKAQKLNPILPSLAKEEEWRRIIAAGGDGTFNEVINGIAGTDIPMAILPLGTTNVLAKELNIPEDVDRAVDVALNGNSHKICLGRITLIQNSNPLPPCDSPLLGESPEATLAKGGQRGVKGGLRGDNRSSLITRYFLLMAGVGYDGQTVYGVKGRIKKYSGKGAYIVSGLNTLLRWNPEKLTFKINGEMCSGYSAIICNASKYAGNFAVAPDAKLSDSHLYVFIMLGRKKLDIVRYIVRIMNGRHTRLSDILYLQAKIIEIDGDAHIQIDGDYLGKTPAKIEVVPDALRLIY